MRVCFVLGRLGPSGGVRSVLAHARHLASQPDIEVTIAVTEGPLSDAAARGVEIVTVEDARAQSFDVGIATWWRTTYSLFRIPARRRAYLIQNFEERLYRPGDVERIGAAITRDLPVAFLTEARWIRDELAELRPDAPCFHIPNGIDKTLFESPDRPHGRSSGPLRVLVEGSPHLWFKGIPEALAVLHAMRADHHATLVTPEAPPPEVRGAFDEVVGPLAHEEMPAHYSRADVLLKLSRVEGVFTPPLEAFHRGVTCVVWPVTGHDEYVEHGVNGIVSGWDDIGATARWLDLLATDAALLARLRRGALDAASRWPSWEDAARGMAAALRQIESDPEPMGAPGVAQLLGDAHVGMEELRLKELRLRREIERCVTELASERAGRTVDREHAARLEQALASTLGARARRLLASRRR